MQNLKIFKVLSRLDVYTLNRFKKFVHSPYFNQNGNIISLFNFYYDHLKNNSTEELEKEEIWSSCLPQESYNDARFRKYNTDLLNLLEQFIAVEQFKSQPLQESSSLLEGIIDLKLPELHNTVLKTTERLSKKHEVRNANYYFYQYMAEKHRFNLTSEFERKSASKSKLNLYNVQEINDNLDYFFIAEKLRYYCSMLSWKNVVKHDIELLFIDDIVELVQNKKYYNIPTIGIYYQIYLTTVEPEEPKHYFKLKELIRSNLDLFPVEEGKQIYDSLLNYSIRKVNAGEKEFFNEIFNLYKEGLESKILMEDGYLGPTSFRNISITALRLGHIDWTEDFIHTYQSFLKEKYRENAVKFNLARLYGYKKDFSKVVEQLREVEFNDLLYDLASKSMLLSAYYELNEIESLYSLFQSFNTFLSRHKNIPENLVMMYKNLIKYTKKLLSVSKKKKKEIEEFKLEVRNVNNIASKEWLLEKIEELL